MGDSIRLPKRAVRPEDVCPVLLEADAPFALLDLRRLERRRASVPEFWDLPLAKCAEFLRLLRSSLDLQSMQVPFLALQQLET